MIAKTLKGFGRRVGVGQQVEILLGDRAPFGHRRKIQDLIPVFAAVQDDREFLRQLVGLRERQNFEELVARPEPARKNHHRRRQVREPELPHEEVMEFEVQTVGDVFVRALFVRQPDIQADRLAAGLVRAAIGGFHDARPAARRDDEAVVLGLATMTLHAVSCRASSRASS